MQTIFELKEQAVTETPLLLFDCTLADGREERWSTHGIKTGDRTYEARVLRHNIFELQAASDQGVDGVPRISLTLANADAHFSELERSAGMKGARLTVKFVFHDLSIDEPATEEKVVFQGICNPPEEITEAAFRISASNRMNVRALLPQVRIQRRCPWNFPATAEERTEAAEGGEAGKYSRFYRCGYSAGEEGGAGLPDGSAPFTWCGYTRGDCAARGMTERFGGIEFVPSTIDVRSYGEKGSHASAVIPNEARYNDFVPMLYGTAWYTPPVVFARNDGNLTHMEVLLGIGEFDGVLKVLVNDVEIPLGRQGLNMTGTGWYNVPTLGTRSGGFNLDFLKSDGTPAGDPYGSMAYLSLVTPNRISDGKSLPRVKVLARGLKLPRYNPDGTFDGEHWSANPAWILLDILQRTGWKLSELNAASFAAAAAYCDEEIAAQDPYGNAIAIPRFECNLTLQKRRSAGDVLRGIRNSARLFLTYGDDGRVELRIENSMAVQQPVKPAGSNSTQPLAGGWPAYEFGDGTNGLSGILRKANGEPHVRGWSRSSSDAPNRFTVEFQDSLNEYQQDGYSLVDADDVARTGQEVTASLPALGVPNCDQAGRLLRYALDRSVRGNTYIEFATSVNSLGLCPGDLITFTYLREGFERQPFRVLKIAPGTNFGTAVITAQIHSNDWYLDTNGQGGASGGRREGGAGLGTPRPIGGATTGASGEAQFGIQEIAEGGSVELEVAFAAPSRLAADGPGIPLISLAATVSSGGTLNGGQTFYYAAAGVDGDGAEGRLSFVVRATVPEGTGQSVKLHGLRFAPGTTGFHVYRGSTPSQLYRIASNLEPATEFIDDGRATELTPAPDPNFDHANFYWRMELQPEVQATIHDRNTIGNGTLEMEENAHRGASARITRGTGAGQERAVVANSRTTLTVAPPWDVAPEAGSRFAVGEAGWKFGALSSTSPVRFAVPDRPGETVQVCGQAANVNDEECAAELSIVTRWKVGGGGAGDADVPPAPSFGFNPGARGGTVEVRGLGFPTLENTRTISSGTLTLHYWNELAGSTAFQLAEALSATDEEATLSTAGTAASGDLIQIEAEILAVADHTAGGTQYGISRGMFGTTAAAHAAGAPVYHLDRKTLVLPFPPDFFGSPYSGTWFYPISLPDVRMAGAELFLTNRHGNGPASHSNFTQGMNYGLRTLSGGQYTIQVSGFLAIEQSAAPALVVEATHPARDVFAILGEAADGPVEVQVTLDGAEYCRLTVPAGQTTSSSVDGFHLPLLLSGGRVSISLLSVGQSVPGSDLTVVIRL